MTSPRLALVLRALDGGGMQRCMLDLAEAFVARGLAVDLLVGEAGGALSRHLPAGVALHPLPATSPLAARRQALARLGRAALPLAGVTMPRMLGHLDGLAGWLREHRPDALLAMGTQSNLVALWARALADVPTRVVVCECTTLSVASRRRRFGFRRAYPKLVRACYPRAEGIIAVSQAVADDLAATSGLAPDSITAIPNWVRPAPAAVAPPPHPWLAPGEPPVILGVGRLHWQKDFPALLHAFARLRRQRLARLAILGEGAERARLERLARREGVADDVLLPGFADDPWAWMARARVLAVTSVSEGFGNVIVEALASGLPVVSLDCPGGPREILGRGAFGRLVPPGDPGALARALATTLDRPPDPAALRARAAAFSLPRAAERYLHLLLEGTRDAA